MPEIKGISDIAYANDVDWGAESGTWTQIGIKNILKESLGFDDPEEFLTRLADETDDLDGIKQSLTILIKANAANKPPSGAGVWFRIHAFSGIGTALWFGGAAGCTVRNRGTRVRALGDGQWYDAFVAEASGSVVSDIIKYASAA